jgi:four helix bundle protein
MGRGQGFEDLLVWQKSMDLAGKVYRYCRTGDLAKDWGFRDQMQRAAVSVATNIAEGYERGSKKEYSQFVMIAKGSVGELRCLSRLASRLKYINEQTDVQLIEDSAEIARMLRGLANSLKAPKA